MVLNTNCCPLYSVSYSRGQDGHVVTTSIVDKVSIIWYKFLSQSIYSWFARLMFFSTLAVKTKVQGKSDLELRFLRSGFCDNS